MKPMDPWIRGFPGAWLRLASVILIATLSPLVAAGPAADPTDIEKRHLLPAEPDLKIPRTNARSPRYYVAEKDVGFFINYSGWNPKGGPHGDGERFTHSEIETKELEMIANAKRFIILSVFLMDNVYAPQASDRNITGEFTDSLVRKKRENPDMAIAIILDPIHKAYGNRIAPAEQRFREAGIDVFYSDLIGGLKKGSFVGISEGVAHANRLLDFATFRAWDKVLTAVLSRIRLPRKLEFDGERITLEMICNSLLIKANHRKILFTDDGRGGYETLVTSANPHNPSAHHGNTALWVKGEVAKFVYLVLREDIARCIQLGGEHSHWNYGVNREYRKSYLQERMPRLNLDFGAPLKRTSERPVGVEFLCESEIVPSVIEALEGVEPGDDVRILMFYLSYQPVLKALIRASQVDGARIRILLDPNKDSPNWAKDGTPNRQAARYLLRKVKKAGGQIEIRWYLTHGEQSHAKTMSITNPRTGKWILTAGSCNWTGRNMAGVNMEANLWVVGAKDEQEKFNRYFDLFWSNQDGMEYSVDYDVFSDSQSMLKWRLGERPFYYSVY